MNGAVAVNTAGRAQALHLLASTPLFRGLTLNDLSELFREVRHREAPAGTTLHAPTEAGEVLYFLKRGRVRLYRMTTSGPVAPRRRDRRQAAIHSDPLA